MKWKLTEWPAIQQFFRFLSSDQAVNLDCFFTYLFYLLVKRSVICSFRTKCQSYRIVRYLQYSVVIYQSVSSEINFFIPFILSIFHGFGKKRSKLLIVYFLYFSNSFKSNFYLHKLLQSSHFTNKLRWINFYYILPRSM